jgi:hypothetical protein
VGEAEIEVPFLINQAIVLSRELCLHTNSPTVNSAPGGWLCSTRSETPSGRG